MQLPSRKSGKSFTYSILNIEGSVKDAVLTLASYIPDAASCDYQASHQPATINNHNIPFALEVAVG